MVLFSGETTWFQCLSTLDGDINYDQPIKNTRKVIETKKRAAIEYIKSDHAKYLKQIKSSKTNKKEGYSITWIDKLIKTGSFEDKVSGLAFKVSYCALHNLDSLEMLVQLTKKKFRESRMVITYLKDLFLQTLLPSTKALKKFQSKPLKDSKVSIKVFVLWYLEEEIKKQYSEFLTSLQLMTLNSLEVVQKEAYKNLSMLLDNNPEQEQYILQVLVNGFADKNRTVSSSIMLYLSKVLDNHYHMSVEVVKEINKFIFSQPHILSRPVYLALRFLGQLRYDQEDSTRELPNLVIEVCVKIIEKISQTSSPKTRTPGARRTKLKKRKRELPSDKLLSTTFSALNKAVSHTKTTEALQKNVELLFKLTHSKTYSLSIQSFLLLLKIMKAKKSASDRYYRSLYLFLLDSEALFSNNKQFFFKLIQESLEFDKNPLRVSACLKRLLQLSSMAQPSFTIAILLLIHLITFRKSKFAFLFNFNSKKIKSLSNVVTDQENNGLLLNITTGDQNDVSNLEIEDQDASNPKVTQEENKKEEQILAYDETKRDPKYAVPNQESGCLTELSYLMFHYHPDVRYLAKCLLRQTNFKKKLFNLESFYDKSSETDFFDILAFKTGSKIKNGSMSKEKKKIIPKYQLIAANSPEYLEKDISSRRPSELYIFKYFYTKMILEGETITKLKRKREDLIPFEIDSSKLNEFENEESDDEFATKLALDLMKDRGIGVDIDD